MRKFQCSLFVLKRSYICYYLICMTVPLIKNLANKKDFLAALFPPNSLISLKQLSRDIINYITVKQTIFDVM